MRYGLFAIVLLFSSLLRAQIADLAREGRFTKSLLLQGMAGQTVYGAFETGYGIELSLLRNLASDWRAGIGAGFNRFGHEEYKRLVPCYAEVQWAPLGKKRHSPYLLADSGYAWAWKDRNSFYREVRGGLRLHLATGMRWNLFKNSELRSEIGVIRQSVRSEQDFFWWGGAAGEENFTRETLHLHRWVLRIGYSF
jgi:hypothetical protein